MPVSPVDPHGATPSELKERIAADREGQPYLLFRDGESAQRIAPLTGSAKRLTIGRAPGCELTLDWDPKVSGAHAQLERIAEGAWVLADDGLSRNGSYVNGERLRQRRRLADGDLLRFGDTQMVFRAPSTVVIETVAVSGELAAVQLSPAQRRVLVALCRPFAGGHEFATPASNNEIAEELVVSVDAVKTHLRALFEKFGIEDLPRQAKRAQLVRRAFQTGAITPGDLEG
jgi:pSer/pThr/pTyr-binding forkhead associated (FHA) protein